MLLAAWAMTRPRSASAKSPQRGATALAAASSPPISAEVSVMLKTQARVMRSQRETPSIARPLGRLPVAMIWRQLSSSVPKPGGASSPGMTRVSAMTGPLGGRGERINPASSCRQGGEWRGRRGLEGAAERRQGDAPQHGRREEGGRGAEHVDHLADQPAQRGIVRRGVEERVDVAVEDADQRGPLARRSGKAEVRAGGEAPRVAEEACLGAKERARQGGARRPDPVEALRQEGRRDRGGRHALSIDRIEGAHRVADGEEAVEALRPALVVPEAVRHGAVRVDGGDRLGELDRVRDDRGAEPGERGAEPRLVARRVVAGDAGDGHDPAPPPHPGEGARPPWLRPAGGGPNGPSPPP